MITRIAIVDDEPAIRDGLSALLLAEGWQVDQFADAESLMAVLSDLSGGASSPWHAALLDVRLPGMDGVKLMGHVSRALPDLPVLMISGHADVPVAVAAMRAGARDFVEKPFRAETVLAKLGNLLTEQAGPDSPKSSGGDLTVACEKLGLTNREAEIAIALTSGQTSKEIARSLNISPRTVDTHRRNILHKADARNTAELLTVLMR
ncbi:MAG: response regulator [Alphaproteobacteria bacterium]